MERPASDSRGVVALRFGLTAEWRVIGALNGHAAKVWCIQFSADGNRLASGSDDGTARVWQVATLSELARISAGRPVKLWDTSTHEEVIALPGRVNKGMSLVFATDGDTLVSTRINGTVRFWRAASH